MSYLLVTPEDIARSTIIGPPSEGGGVPHLSLGSWCGVLLMVRAVPVQDSWMLFIPVLSQRGQ